MGAGDRGRDDDLCGRVAGEDGGVCGSVGWCCAHESEVEAAVVGEVGHLVGGEVRAELADEVVVCVPTRHHRCELLSRRGRRGGVAWLVRCGVFLPFVTLPNARDALNETRWLRCLVSDRSDLGEEGTMTRTRARSDRNGWPFGYLESGGVDINNTQEVGAKIRHHEILLCGISEHLVRMRSGLSSSIRTRLCLSKVEFLLGRKGSGVGVDHMGGQCPAVVGHCQQLTAVEAADDVRVDGRQG